MSITARPLTGSRPFNGALTTLVAVLGMELESVTLKLPRDLLSGAQCVATAREVTIGHMVRQLLKREVARQMSQTRSKGPDERLIVALQALLARDMVEAESWSDLQARIRTHGYDFRPDSGSTALFKSSCGTRICQAAALGFGYVGLLKRLGDHVLIEQHSSPSTGVMPAGQIDPKRHAVLSAHISAAQSWPDLINRLAGEGMELRLLGPALGIYRTGTGRHLCNSGAVGAGYDILVERYGGPIAAAVAPSSEGHASNARNGRMG